MGRRNGFWLDEEKIERRRLEREREMIAEMDASPLGDGLCYFVGSIEDGVVKIGFSRHLTQRLNTLRGSSLFKVSLLATARGGWAREKHYHEKFTAHAIGGEWFLLHPDIHAEIEHLRSMTPTASFPSHGGAK